jgi:hypothetical protein
MRESNVKITVSNYSVEIFVGSKAQIAFKCEKYFIAVDTNRKLQ